MFVQQLNIVGYTYIYIYNYVHNPTHSSYIAPKPTISK